MNDKLIENINKLKEAARQKSMGGHFDEHFGNNATLIMQVRDPIYCRTFELDTFYEFDDARTIDLDNIDMTMQLLVLNANKEVIYTLAAIRLATHPAANGVFDIINPFMVKDIADEVILVLNDLLSQLGAHTILVTGLQAATEVVENYKKDKYTLLDTYSDVTCGETLHLLYKKL